MLVDLCRLIADLGVGYPMVRCPSIAGLGSLIPFPFED